MIEKQLLKKNTVFNKIVPDFMNTVDKPELFKDSF